MKPRAKPKAKTMKKHIGKFVVMALVAMFALSSQSEAACVNIYQAIYKMKQEERAPLGKGRGQLRWQSSSKKPLQWSNYEKNPS